MHGAEECFYTASWGIERCPFEELSEKPQLVQLMSFVNKAMDSWDVDIDPVSTAPRVGAPVTEKKKKKQYGISVEKFQWACQLHLVVPEDQLEALTWCGIAVQAANEAPELEIIKQRQERAKYFEQLRRENKE